MSEIHIENFRFTFEFDVELKLYYSMLDQLVKTAISSVFILDSGEIKILHTGEVVKLIGNLKNLIKQRHIALARELMKDNYRYSVCS